MKQIIVSLIVLIIGTSCFCQKHEGLQSIQIDYLHKSKQQKTAGWILLSGGAALVTVGALIPQDDKGVDPGNVVAKDLLYVTGGILMLGSIPQFIAAGKNKKKALSVSANFKMQKSQVIRRASFADKSYPAVAVKLNF